MMDLVEEEYLHESIYTNIQTQGENVHGKSLEKISTGISPHSTIP